MAQLPGVLLLYGCFAVAASVATVLWSLVQAGLDLAGTARRPGPRASAASHLSRATAGAAVAAVTASVPACVGHARLLSALCSAL
jgi:hypothetical protein